MYIASLPKPSATKFLKNISRIVFDNFQMQFADLSVDEAEIDEICTGPDDLRIVLRYAYHRFILIMENPTYREDDEIIAGFFEKLRASDEDLDELAYDRCLEEIRDFAISAAGEAILTFDPGLQAPSKEPRSLQAFLFPPTVYLRLCTEAGKLRAVRMDDISLYEDLHAPMCFPMASFPQDKHILIPCVELEFVRDLYMGKVLQVSWNGTMCAFKAATYGSEDQFKREVHVLQQILQTWSEGYHKRPNIPRLLGLVTANDQIVGFLEEFIRGESLYEIKLDQMPISQSSVWLSQVQKLVKLLHRHGLTWGDVKPHNIFIDEDKQAWLIDFGGSSTDGWVDQELAETIQGDLQGLRNVSRFLGLVDAETIYNL